jgi:alkylhydroperoxidase/carboxymuconolactone decarboxylase family protein YurZ
MTVDDDLSSTTPDVRARVLAAVDAVDPAFALVATRALDASTERSLSAREAAIIGMVVHGNISYYDPQRMAELISTALEAGATGDELAKVIELTAVMGYHGVAVTAPLLLDQLRRRGQLPTDPGIPPGTTDNIRHSMIAEWTPAADQLTDFARLSPHLADLMSDWTRISWNQAPLDRKLKELIYLAFDATPTHIFLPGVGGHVHRCLEAGATFGEIAQVLEITVQPAMTTVARTFDILRRALAGPDGP